ncbi:hypothetical protein [Aquimarina sp. Aq78]|uniref:hypothetical protein n=1 Tax=Aquimarina sp. Aq78 TaxID=1191889 RepID=UPI000D0E6F55|nr:hypothetical protein [Aquimarina sp. Aq78]
MKWYLVYNEFANLLNEFGLNNNSPGETLFNILVEDSEFISENNWINNHRANLSQNSIDPIHVFSSFNGSKQSGSSRIKRINILFRILTSKNETIKNNTDKTTSQSKIYENIDFSGCPSPFNVKMLSVRDIDSQKEIWENFLSIHNLKQKGVTQNVFDQLKKWYGIDIISYTQFLFWIDSSNFLPLDKNTVSFLLVSKKIETRTLNFLEYKNLLTETNTGIYRELAVLAYDFIGENRRDFKYSKKLNRYLNDEKLKDFSNQGFKIIAIEPIEGYNEAYLNILSNNTIYYLENVYKIDNNKVLYNNSENSISLYEQKTRNNNILKINVSAIVGKNGSGKSSLIELFFRVINNLAFLNKNILKTEDLIFEEGLGVKLYYIILGKFLCLEIIDKSIILYDYDYVEQEYIKKEKSRKFKVNDFYDFFYSIVVNYSHYSLNSKIVGPWIEKLFHKNDAYQTPLVINPMRTSGNIDINTENDLVKSRLLANLFSPIEDDDIGIRQITENQEAFEVVFTMNYDKNLQFYRDIENETGYEPEDISESIKPTLEFLFKKFDFTRNDYSTGSIEDKTEKYIFRKMVKIADLYRPYKDKNYVDYSDGIPKFRDELLEEYIYKIKRDKSHITYKLKQAINYLKFYNLIEKKEKFTLELNSLYDNIQKENYHLNKPEINEIDIIELLPPSFFNAEIKLRDKRGKPSDFEKLSSGEKQQIHSISSILYHIQNIDSVNSHNKELIDYRNINLILDEIELYYHPELQRKYLSYLLKMIGKLSLNKIEAFNICLVTHSPFILSDIPSSNILRLDNGKTKTIEQQTFGANVHDLLANDFFLKKGFMGEFAKEKIKDIIELMKDVQEKKYEKNKFDEIKVKCKNIIDIVGEPILYLSLIDLYSQTFKESRNEFINDQIKKLEKLRDDSNT